MQTTEISFRSGQGTLVGTLCAATSPDRTPVALLVSGSGPLDRNSNMKRMPIDVMGQVANHLQRAGISSFRYDKRGVGQSDGDFFAAGLHDNVADARAAVAMLRSQPELQDCPVFVVGHSEGAIIAIELAATDQTLAGSILLAGTASTGEDVLRWQAHQVKDTLPKAVTLLLRVLRQDLVKTQTKRLAQLRNSTEDMIRIQFVKVNAKWMREFMAHDPSASLPHVEMPLLAITGSKDLQVNPDDVEKISALAAGDSSGHVLEDVTHLLRSEAGPATVRTYKKQIKRPVESRVLDMVAQWIADVAAEVPAANPS